MAETKVITSKLIVMCAVEPKDELDEVSAIFLLSGTQSHVFNVLQ